MHRRAEGDEHSLDDEADEQVRTGRADRLEDGEVSSTFQRRQVDDGPDDAGGHEPQQELDELDRLRGLGRRTARSDRTWAWVRAVNPFDWVRRRTSDKDRRRQWPPVGGQLICGSKADEDHRYSGEVGDPTDEADDLKLDVVQCDLLPDVHARGFVDDGRVLAHGAVDPRRRVAIRGLQGRLR